MLLAHHQVLLDAGCEAADRVDDAAAQAAVPGWRLEAEGLEVEARAAALASAGLEGAHQRRARALAAACRVDPKLLQFAARPQVRPTAPPSTVPSASRAKAA